MKIKPLHILIGLALLILGCNATEKSNQFKAKKTQKTQEYDTIEIANDSLEYKIIILEIGFNSWLATQRPRGYYSQTFLENKNRILVSEYNSRVNEPSRFDPQLYPFRIDYDSRTDYGYEVNYLLYHYFLFFQQKYNQNLRY
ncbi:hypothetical protein EIG84_05415 [Flavobacteriaceae bacterium 14752]|nr:hypothetical protein EIG84_05415 [Flavobacteriaceae bacterium 14752]